MPEASLAAAGILISLVVFAYKRNKASLASSGMTSSGF
jgi:hypothetical protein